MPFYDLRCNRCDEEFSIMATMADKASGTIPCPECGETGLETVYISAPYVMKGHAPDPVCPNSASCASACCHAKSS